MSSAETRAEAGDARPEAARRRVGRPTRAPERREQILEAVERCIVERGLEATTLAAVAETARVPRSLIHHYLGNRDALLRAAADRALANAQRALGEALAAGRAEGEDELARALDVLFGPAMLDPRITHLIDELGVAALRDATVRRRMARMYASFVDDFEAALARDLPEAPAAARRTVAHAVIGLVDAASRFEDYGFDPENFARMRRVAEGLVDGLREAARTGG